MAYLFRFWMRGSEKADVRLLRIELMAGHRDATVNPTVRVFSARAKTPKPV